MYNIYIVWFRLYKILENTNESIELLGDWGGQGHKYKGHRKLQGGGYVRNLKVAMFSRVHTYIKTQQTVYLKRAIYGHLYNTKADFRNPHQSETVEYQKRTWNLKSSQRKDVSFKIIITRCPLTFQQLQRNPSAGKHTECTEGSPVRGTPSKNSS